jgi:hypothetical protein
VAPYTTEAISLLGTLDTATAQASGATPTSLIENCQEGLDLTAVVDEWIADVRRFAPWCRARLVQYDIRQEASQTCHPNLIFLGDRITIPSSHTLVHRRPEALAAALGSVTFPSDSSTPLVPHRPVHDRARTPQQIPGGLYIIDGTRYGDVWIQDEMEIGYAFAPHGWMHVVMHCKRNRPLAQFVDSELAAPGVGLFTGLSSRSSSPSTLRQDPDRRL